MRYPTFFDSKHHEREKRGDRPPPEVAYCRKHPSSIDGRSEKKILAFERKMAAVHRVSCSPAGSYQRIDVSTYTSDVNGGGTRGDVGDLWWYFGYHGVIL